MIRQPDLFIAPPIYENGKLKISSVLIANRGEIACRVIATCKKLGITTFVVFTDADANAPFVKLADKAHYLGDPESQPYQNGELIIEIAKRFGADAIHPGYGYLSENADFAAAVGSAGLIFLGPSPQTIAALGDKREAKEFLAARSSVPLVPGYGGLDQDPELLEKEADRIGYPVMIKASAGGGGKGMRIVYSKEDFRESLQRCTSEAGRLFGSAHCLIEKYIEAGKHVEMQIFGDGETAVSFLDRECSVQRRNQKIIEESPCPWLSAEMRQDMSNSALEIARLLKYESAGTVEFIVDVKNERYYFLEVNTRIQVEHPITEEVVGIDLIALQIYVAGGGKLQALTQLQDIKQTGHSIEVRLCAEDPFHDFRPCTGTICQLKTPLDSKSEDSAGLRYELGVERGSAITVHFDSMISKIIVWAPNRAMAIAKMIRALKNTICFGLTTNQVFLQRILASPHFHDVSYTTALIPQNIDELTAPLDTSSVDSSTAIAALEISRLKPSSTDRRSAFKSIPKSFRNQRAGKNMSAAGLVSSEITKSGQDEKIDMLLSKDDMGAYRVVRLDPETPPTSAEEDVYFNKEGGPLVKRYYSAIRSKRETRFDGVSIVDSAVEASPPWSTGQLKVSFAGQIATYDFALASQGEFKKTIYIQESGSGIPILYTVSGLLAWAGMLDEKASEAQKANSRVSTCPMPSKILEVTAKDGTWVKVGDKLLVLESMKMEIQVTSSAEGIVSMQVKEGDILPEGSVLCEILEGDEEGRSA
ncbi:hypothetical protein BHE90_000806 [Fusarium euwallaceae]|uniref:Methylcrotonoyl-CoA carboxylase subunit alpha, mitochondrial n=1 Tax=Fusarium euwallaceae TaxID=1147111 RepID=A0A430M9V9_9HYPO|nr:hypothetical protein BHE90_000806 [Fusarium euwallaceae]